MPAMDTGPDTTFSRLDGPDRQPHDWQRQLAAESTLRDRLIRIPTGFGKTLGVLAAWVHHRVVRADDTWPRRLVWCLPMRVLVEQTKATVEAALARAGLLWDGDDASHAGKVGVHLLMGGAEQDDWHLHPEHPAVLIGTQDMLLSRALNRGYASGRAHWPIDFGLLNQDALWVMDEVQLMDVGLATSAQLQAFRAKDQDQARTLRPCRTWWMSATLQPDWLKQVDTAELVAELTTPPDRVIAIPASERHGDLWAVTKPLTTSQAHDPVAVAALSLKRHRALADGPHGRISLVVCNTVDRAVAVAAAIRKGADASTEVRLVHSRFRGHERSGWREAFLNRDACRAGADRIIVATQVVEAGVDLSAGCLITDLAPWPSLVQRFGRAARYGGSAEVIVILPEAVDEETAAPYQPNELIPARDLALATLTDAGPATIEAFEAGLDPAQRQQLYPYAPEHILLREEWDELFDTAADLSGADLDISRFIRSGKERDCLVAWADWEGDAPDHRWIPSRDALCPVPFIRAREWLFTKTSQKRPRTVYVRNYVAGGWRMAQRKEDCYPGQVIVVAAAFGGYDPDIGFTGLPASTRDRAIPPVPETEATPEQRSSLEESSDDLSQAEYQTVCDHDRSVGSIAVDISTAVSLPPPVSSLLGLSGRWHDTGKGHVAFVKCINPGPHRFEQPLAKAPKAAWMPLGQLYQAGPELGQRKGFRHEWASALAMLELLARTCPEHPALRGGLGDLLGPDLQAGTDAPITDNPLANELAALSAEAFDLVLYLVAAHHGKVRGTVHATAADQAFPLADRLGQPLRGVCDGDALPAMQLPTADGAVATLPTLQLRLDVAKLGLSSRYGRSWRERCLALQRQRGPAALAYLEALLRAADVRASRTLRSSTGATP